MRPDTQLAGKRVLITRAREDGSRLRGLLEELGATVVELPAVAIEPPRDFAPLDAALRSLSRYHWIAFTSRNAVRAVFDRLPALGLPTGLPPDLRVAAVGPSTEADLRAHGVIVSCVPARAKAGELAAAMSRVGVEDARVLLPAGDLARPELRHDLEQAGARVDQVVAYRTVRPSKVDASALEALRRGAIDVVAVASPSAIRNLVDMLDGELACLRGAQLACIGPTTAAAVRDLGLSPAAVATGQSLDGLVEAIVSLAPEHSYERA